MRAPVGRNQTNRCDNASVFVVKEKESQEERNEGEEEEAALSRCLRLSAQRRPISFSREVLLSLESRRVGGGVNPTSEMTSKRKSIFETIDDLLSPDPCPSSSTSSASCSSDSPKLTCQFCKKTYLTYFGLRRHLQFHKEGKLQQSCPHCKKVYRSPGALKMHLKTHSLPCVCSDCGKSFSRPWLLKGHLRTHTGEKPFGCEFCGRFFADRSNLRAHLQTHSGEKKHRCSRCGQSFARVQVRQRHEQCCRKTEQADS